MTDDEIIQRFLAGDALNTLAEGTSAEEMVRARLHELTAYKAHHLAGLAKRRRKYRTEHPTANAERVAQWQQKHPEKVREYQRISRARKRAKKIASALDV